MRWDTDIIPDPLQFLNTEQNRPSLESYLPELGDYHHDYVFLNGMVGIIITVVPVVRG